MARGARDGQRAERSGGTGTRLYAALGVFPYLLPFSPPHPIPSFLRPCFLRHTWCSALLVVSPCAPSPPPRLCSRPCCPPLAFIPLLPLSESPSHRPLWLPALSLLLSSPPSCRALSPTRLVPLRYCLLRSRRSRFHTFAFVTLVLSRFQLADPDLLFVRRLFDSSGLAVLFWEHCSTGSRAHGQEDTQNRGGRTLVAGGMAAACTYGQGEAAGSEGKHQHRHQGHG